MVEQANSKNRGGSEAMRPPWAPGAAAPSRWALLQQRLLTIMLLLCLLAVPAASAKAARLSMASFISKADLEAHGQAFAQAGSITQTTPCPFPYPRHTQEDIQDGQLPYLYGGARQPCNSCRKGDIPEFCQFLRPVPDQLRPFQHTAHICSPEQHQHFLQYLLQQGFWDYLLFTPCDLWPYLRGRTLWVVGDSQALDLHIAAECFMREFWDLVQYPVRMPPDMEQRFEDFGVKGGQDMPHCAHLPDSTRICFVRANEATQVLDLALPWLLESEAQAEDILVVNFGLWHHDQTSYWQDLERMGKLYAAHRVTFPHILWRETTPQHFLTPGGLFIKGIGLGQPPFQCAPIGNVSLLPDHTLVASTSEQETVVRGSWRNEAARQVLGRYKMPVVAAWNVSVPLWEYHRSNMGRSWECGHYCHPSAPQLWLHSLAQVLAESVQPITHALPPSLHPPPHAQHHRRTTRLKLHMHAS